MFEAPKTRIACQTSLLVTSMRVTFATPGNHDGMVAPNSKAKTLAAFIENFCAPTPQRNEQAGELARTAQIQPAVYFTFEAPFVRILGPV